ncbi:hypothetical protein MUP77_02165 [Candidatus Bathyarchaeota archaeon]|nr:hypothetical protein [Candidatus Bathyarchaeota archaeon]
MIPAREIFFKFKDILKIEFGFSEELKTTLCREIQEKIYGRYFDLNNPVGFKAFIDAGGHSDKGCFKICGIAAKIGAEKIIELTRRMD